MQGRHRCGHVLVVELTIKRSLAVRNEWRRPATLLTIAFAVSAMVPRRAGHFTESLLLRIVLFLGSLNGVATVGSG